MTTARRKLVDPDVTRWYHCISRCVRRAFLLGSEGGGTDRKAWLQNRLKELADVFAIAVAGFSILDNHLHVLIRLDPDLAKDWSDEDVARRWGQLYPPRNRRRETLPVSPEWIKKHTDNPDWIAKARERLKSLSWFMKLLKEQSPHTSVTERIEHAWPRVIRADFEAALRGRVVENLPVGAAEQTHWLCPLEDRSAPGVLREGMMPGLSLPKYLLLLDYSARVFREGKANLSADVAPILTRLGTTAETWQEQLTQLKKPTPDPSG